MPYDNSGGTGSPIAFKCAALRRVYWKDQMRAARRHTVHLTGRTKPNRRRRGVMRGHRSTDTYREYACTCGHRGWSAHVDLVRLVNRHTEDCDYVTRKLLTGTSRDCTCAGEGRERNSEMDVPGEGGTE